MHFAAEVLARGGQVLLLVPEIALTAQLVDRLRQVFGERVIAYHSKLTDRKRKQLREIIEHDALDWAVGIVEPGEIDEINILNASILAMHRALDQLKVRPEAVIVDGNRFKPYRDLPYTTIVKGDGKYLSIAAASILAKTYRDDYMDRLAEDYPQYDWKSNKGYPTKKHRQAIRECGITPFHRRSFTLLPPEELTLDFEF